MPYMMLRVLIAAIISWPALAYTQSSEQVNTTATQTLTNKTLTAPVINGGSITGSITGSATYDTPTITSPTINGSKRSNKN